MPGTDFGDARVASASCSGLACPEQYDGRLIDGRHFYFRYRWGWAYVGVGDTPGAAIDNDAHGRTYGGPLCGQWPTVADRDAAFRELLDASMGDDPR